MTPPAPPTAPERCPTCDREGCPMFPTPPVHEEEPRDECPGCVALADECERLRGTVSALDLKVSDAEQSHMAAIATERRRREAVEIERDGAALDRRRHFALYTREHEINATLTTRIATLEAELVQARAHQCGGIRAGTVGGLLATAPVGAIVEWHDGDEWRRVDMRHGLRAVEYWCATDRRWLSDDGYLWPSSLHLPARLVPAAEADTDPSQRGPLLAATAPVCPGPDCPMCNGEACDKCNPGPGRPRCDHDGQERHEPPTATPRCSCTHEAGDSICDAHPACSECGDSTARNVDDCADHCQVCASLRRGDVITDWTATCQACKARGQLPKGG